MARRLSGLGAAALLCPLVALAGRRLVAALLPSWFRDLRPVVVEPAGIEERLAAAAGRRELSASEVKAFDRDGFIIVRGLLPEKALLRELSPLLRQHQQSSAAMYTMPWLYNGALRSLLRASPLADLAVVLLKGPAVLDEAPIWGLDGYADEEGRPGQNFAAWHADLPQELMGWRAQVTGWLAITEAPHALELIRGSMRSEVRKDIFAECNQSRWETSGQERLLHATCAGRYARERLDPKLGLPCHVRLDMHAGDAVFFHGSTVHRGMFWHRPRLAVSVRLGRPLFPNGTVDEEAVAYYQCHEDRTVFFPPGRPRGDPLGCIREALLGRPDKDANLQPDRLPAERELGPASRLLRRVVAGVESALIAV